MDWKYYKEIIRTPRLFYKLLAGRKIFRFLPDKIAIKILWKNEFGTNLNLEKTRSFNEKLQWLKLYFREDLMTKIVDKIEVKAYVQNLISQKYVIPTILFADTISEIDFDCLPSQFVIKTSAGGGGEQVEIVTNKNNVDWKRIITKFRKFSTKSAFYPGREWPYKKVKNRILIEELIGEGNLLDYKIFCFDGEPKFFKVDFNRFSNHGANYYTLDGHKLPFGEISCPPNEQKEISLPANFDEMITISRKLSANWPFVRVDLYNVDGEIYFGEMTFYPASGMGRFTDEKWDLILGDYINLPE